NEVYDYGQNSCYDSTSIGFDQSQPQQFTINHPIFNAHKSCLDSRIQLNSTIANIQDQVISITSLCELACQFVQKKLEEKQIEEEKAAKAQYWKPPVCCDDDDDEESSKSLKDNIIFELPPCVAITPSEPVDSLIMGDEHLNTILATESDEFIKSCVENLVPNPSESEGKNGCDVPAGFTTFSNVLFDADYDSDSSDDYDGTLNDVRNALNDRLNGIRMQYLPTTIWRKGDKDRATAMIQAIDKMLKTKRIMISLERDDVLFSPDNEDKVFNPEILSHEISVKIITHVTQEKKLAVSFASWLSEDFDPPFSELLVFKEVPNSMRLLPFSSENEEKVLKPGIYTFKKFHCNLKVFKTKGPRVPILVSVRCQKPGHLAARLGCAETKVATWDDLAFKIMPFGLNVEHLNVFCKDVDLKLKF
nr:hypothetical protein [Tanacetum cinerariifolium]